MLDDGYHGLGLKGAILECVNNRLLDFHGGTAFGPNIASIGHGDVATDVNSLAGDGDEITGANAALGGYKQAPRASLKNRYAKNIPDAETNVSWAVPVGEVGDEPGRRLGQYRRDLGRDANKGVRNVFRVVLARPNIPARRPIRWHQGAPSHREVRHQE